MINKEINNIKKKVNKRLREASQTTFYGTVKEVHPEKKICGIQVGGIFYEDVLLYASEEGEMKGILIIPKIDSTVLVSRIKGSEQLYVSMFSEIDEVKFINTQDYSINITQKEVWIKAYDSTINITEHGLFINKNDSKLEINKEGTLIQNEESKINVKKNGVIIAKGEETLAKILDALISEISLITVPTGKETCGPPLNKDKFEKIAKRLHDCLK